MADRVATVAGPLAADVAAGGATGADRTLAARRALWIVVVVVAVLDIVAVLIVVDVLDR